MNTFILPRTYFILLFGLFSHEICMITILLISQIFLILNVAFSHSRHLLKFILIVTIILFNRYFEVKLISDALSC